MKKKNADWFVPDFSQDLLEKSLKLSSSILTSAMSSERNAAYLDLIHGVEKSNTPLENKYSPVWIFSTGRCGTYGMHSFFNNAKGIASYHRRGKPLVNRNEVFFGLGLALATYEWAEEVCFDFITDQMIGEYLSAATLGKQFVSVDNHQVAWIPVIEKLFPDAVFIHLVRNPLDEISSWLSKEIFSSDQLCPASIQLKQLSAYRSMVMEDCNWDILRRLAWHWKNINLYIDVCLSKLTKNKSLILYSEDLFSASSDSYQSISTHCNLGKVNYLDYKNHFSVKHNEMEKKGEFQFFGRDSFGSGWIENQDPVFVSLAEKYGYL